MAHDNGRVFDQGRKEQGFKNQAHLDAFYATYDHHQACAECHKPGPGAETMDGGYQPTFKRCAESDRLEAIEREVGK